MVIKMGWKIWEDVSEEEEDRLIKRAAEFILKHKIETISLLMLNTIKPMVYVGGELGRFFIAPFLPFLDHKADAFLYTFEQRKNIDKLIELIEKKLKEEDLKKKEQKKPQST